MESRTLDLSNPNHTLFLNPISLMLLTRKTCEIHQLDFQAYQKSLLKNPFANTFT